MGIGSLLIDRAVSQRDDIALLHADGDTTSYRSLGSSIEAWRDRIASMAGPGDVLGVTVDDAALVPIVYAAMLVPDLTLDLGTERAHWSLSIEGDQLQRCAEPVLGTGLSASANHIVVPTSGTTGRPKRVVISDEAQVQSLRLTTEVADEQSTAPADAPPRRDPEAALRSRSPFGLTFCSGMPVRSIAGLSMVHRALVMGEALALPRGLDVRALAQALHSARCTNLGVPPFTAQLLLRHWRQDAAPVPPLVHIGLGGSRVLPDLCRSLEAVVSAPVTTGYGSTELGGVALMARPWASEEERWTTVGRPLGGVEVRLDHREVGDVLVVRSPAAALGVLDEDNELRRFDTWVGTGDLAEHTPSGAIRIVGRHDHVILRGGRRIDPAKVEQIIDLLPGVERSAVLGRDSRIAGETSVVALVQLDDVITLADVRTHCREHLAPSEVPQRFVAVDDIPTTADGTPQRHLLAALLEVDRGD